MFNWLMRKKKSLRDMSLKEVTEKLYDAYPSMQTHGEYTPPQFRCSHWLLLCGPAYQDEGYTGSFLVDATQIYDKVKRIDEGMSTSVVAEEQAKNFFPDWVRAADVSDDSVTFLDKHQRGYLKAYLLDFIAMGACEIYCPTCKTSSRTIVEMDSQQEKMGDRLNYVEHWVCNEGHVLRYQEQQMRWFF